MEITIGVLFIIEFLDYTKQTIRNEKKQHQKMYLHHKAFNVSYSNIFELVYGIKIGSIVIIDICMLGNCFDFIYCLQNNFYTLK